MRLRLGTYLHSQDGFTLVEVIVSVAIAAILMAGLTSVIFTSVRAYNTASSRVEASSQIRNVAFYAGDDVARSGVPVGPGCGFTGSPCTTQTLHLTGLQVSNSQSPVASSYAVDYSWDGSNFVNRTVRSTGATQHVAYGVSAFDWYVDGSYPAITVVIDISVTVGDYTQSQTMRLIPHVDP